MSVTSFSASAIPEAPPAHVHRPRLLDRIGAAAHNPLTIVTAPAGWGKSVLLAGWARAAAASEAVIWLNADAAGPAGLLPALADAMARFGVPADLRGPRAGGDRDDLVRQIVGAIEAMEPPPVIVIDEFHRAAGPGNEADLEHLIRHGSGRLRLILACRADPGLPLHRWRVNGRLVEVRAAELAFTVDEAAQLLRAQCVEVPESALFQLHAYTEGWAAGLRLAVLPVHATPEPVPTTGNGYFTAVSEYLLREVVAPLPADLQQLLYETSAAEQLTAELVEALTGREDGSEVLAQISRANLFLTPTLGPGHWFRYHPLFARTLYAELRRRSPALAASLHRRAAEWYGAHGLAGDALHHALFAEDWRRAIAVLDRHWTDLIVGLRPRRRHHVAPSPPGPDLSFRLALAFAADRLQDGDPEGTRQYLKIGDRAARAAAQGSDRAARAAAQGSDRAARAAAQGSDRAARPGTDRDARAGSHRAARAGGGRAAAPESARAAAFRIADATLFGDPQAALAFAARLIDGDRAGDRAGDRTGDGTADPPTDEVRAVASLAAGRARLRLGQWELARSPLRDALIIAQHTAMMHTQVAAASLSALLDAVQGRLRAAERIGRRVLGTANRFALADASDLGWVRLALAEVQYQRDRLPEAAQYVDEALDLAGGSTDILVHAEVLRARLRFAQGYVAPALDIVAAAREEFPDAGAPTVAALSLTEAEIRLATGDLAAAARLVAECPAGSGFEDWAAAVRAAMLSAEGKYQLAIETIKWVAEGGPAVSLTWRVRAALLTALASQALNDRRGVIRSLGIALAAAEDEGYRRPFSAGGHAVRDLLSSFAPALPVYHPVAAELTRVPADQAVPFAEGWAPGGPTGVLLEPLTERELTVLRYLQGPMSNEEIATRLYVSVNTVKTHLKNIYRKLNAGRRREAVERARQLRLL